MNKKYFFFSPIRERAILLPLLLLFSISSFAVTRYVKEGGTGDGSSWANASGNLSAMIDASVNGDEVWVAEGTYFPSTFAPGYANSNNRFHIFNVDVDIQLLGGFPNTGNPILADRNWAANPTILSGDLNQDDCDGLRGENIYTVIQLINLPTTSTIDGFTIRGGNATPFIGTPHGSIGGAYILNSQCMLKNCQFIQNIGRLQGAIRAQDSDGLTILNCIFSRNQGLVAGAVLNNGSDVIFTNCSFANNSSSSSGATIYNGQPINPSLPTFNNCIIRGAPPVIFDAGNSIFGFSVSTVNFSIIQGGWTGAGGNNLDVDPLFDPTFNDDLRLRACSPAINAGSNALVPAGTTTDLDNNPRIFNTTVDIGAYEFQGATSTVCPPTISITGNGMMVECGSTTPQLSNGTDLGSTFIGSPTTQTFTIINSNPTVPLVIGGMITSTNPAFTLSNIPASVPAGGSATFNVTFTSAVTGTQTSTIQLGDACETNSLNCGFAVQASAETPPIPTMGEWALFLFGLTLLSWFANLIALIQSAAGNGAISLTRVVFYPAAYRAALPKAMGLGVLGLLIIPLIWGTLLPMDLVGLAFSVLLVAYVGHLQDR